MDLGDRIAAWLRVRGMTQAALARATDVTPAAVTAWIKGSKANGGCSPSTPRIEAIASALGLTVAEFYGRIPRGRSAA